MNKKDFYRIVSDQFDPAFRAQGFKLGPRPAEIGELTWQRRATPQLAAVTHSKWPWDREAGGLFEIALGEVDRRVDVGYVVPEHLRDVFYDLHSSIGKQLALEAESVDQMPLGAGTFLREGGPFAFHYKSEHHLTSWASAVASVLQDVLQQYEVWRVASATPMQLEAMAKLEGLWLRRS